MNTTLIIRLTLSIFAIIVGAILIVPRGQKRTNSFSIIAYAICLIIIALSLITISLVTGLLTGLILNLILVFFIGCLPALIFIYTLDYFIQDRQFSYRSFIVPVIIPLFLIIVFFIQKIPISQFTGDGTNNALVVSPADIWRWLLVIFTAGILITSFILTLSISKINLKRSRFGPLILVDLAIIIAILLNLISFTTLIPVIYQFDVILAGFTLIGLAVFITNLRIPQLAFITRDELFFSISDGIIIIDNEDRILDMNPAAEQLIGIPTRSAYGSPIDGILTNWNSISGPNSSKEMEFRGSIYLNKQWRHFSVRINKLGNQTGKVILLRDVPGRNETDENRQRAQEEMFNLLRSFFKSANTAQPSNVFFRDVLFQIGYTFHAESGAIFLVDSNTIPSKFKFVLMASHGALAVEKGSLSNLQEVLDTIQWAPGSKEPVIIFDEGEDQQFAKLSQLIRKNPIALFPMIYDEQMLGVLVLSRADEAGFISDDIIRLIIVIEELAFYVYSDRKRKSDIAIAERQHLAQDLHDSVTQKLYGLVQLTEALKFGLESGALVDTNRMVERISESARQALREMRLFLFELSPVNIERDGLVSAIQQRLASVEGRSDIQARLIGDNEISLSAEKSTEIYYIVEEALNNILKHAKAKSVLLKFNKRKESIFFEIVDNGCGFDPEDVKFGGKGLKNIKDRAARINGKLKIISSPEHGTKITLVVPRL